MSKLSIHLDTDIGDDIDDAFCLSLLLKSPELELRSISTVLNDTVGRADMCRELCDAAEQSPKIVPGAPGIITRRPVPGAVDRIPPYKSRKSYGYKAGDGAILDVLAEARRSCDVLLTIGPLTNLAMSLTVDPDVTRFPRYIAMAGEVLTPFHSEWNIKIDSEAAAVVLSAGMKIDFIPWRIGIDTKLSKIEQRPLDEARGAVMDVLNDFRIQFRQHQPLRQEMFDPMTVVALLHDDWFTWQQGTMTVELRGDQTLGQTIFKKDPAGPHRVAVAIDAEKAKRFMVDRLIGP